MDKISFAQALAIVPNLSLGGLFGVVYEHFLGCLILEDPFLGFWKLFQAVIAHGDIPKLMALVLRVGRLLAMAKDNGGLRPIALGKMFLGLINHSIAL
jgi:hypothetical protein